ncbi:MAG: hypothetical protein WC552_08435 [Candidatus Omnitrophota bacterium]
MWALKNFRSQQQGKKEKDFLRVAAGEMADSGTAQTTVEFSLSLVLVVLMIYGIMMIFRWAGVSLVERRMAHEQVLYMNVEEDWGRVYNVPVGNGYSLVPTDVTDGPLSQIDPNFYKAKKMKAVFGD